MGKEDMEEEVEEDEEDKFPETNPRVDSLKSKQYMVMEW